MTHSSRGGLCQLPGVNQVLTSATGPARPKRGSNNVLRPYGLGTHDLFGLGDGRSRSRGPARRPVCL